MMLARTPCCPSCGRTLPPTTRFGIAMERGYAAIIDALVEAGDTGVRVDKLFDRVYGALEGGPLSGLASLRVRICYLNELLALKGKKIINKRAVPRYRGCHGRYHLVDL